MCHNYLTCEKRVAKPPPHHQHKWRNRTKFHYSLIKYNIIFYRHHYILPLVPFMELWHLTSKNQERKKRIWKGKEKLGIKIINNPSHLINQGWSKNHRRRDQKRPNHPVLTAHSLPPAPSAAAGTRSSAELYLPPTKYPPAASQTHKTPGY